MLQDYKKNMKLFNGLDNWVVNHTFEVIIYSYLQGSMPKYGHKIGLQLVQSCLNFK